MIIEFLDEPELEFGAGGRHIDTRFGLMSHGPLDLGTSRAPGDIKVALVGTHETIEGVSRWIERCSKEIPAKASRQPNLFPRFPGFRRDTCFGAALVLDDQMQVALHKSEMASLVGHVHDPAVVEEAVSKFLKACAYLEEKRAADVFIIAPPSDLLEALEEAGVPAPAERADGSESEEQDDERERVPAFHDLLKARGMTLSKPLQMIRPETYDEKRRRSQKRRPEQPRRVQDEATRAWNFHVALYYKAGGALWRLPRDWSQFQTCFVGVSFYQASDQASLKTSTAQVFNERGDGVIVRGEMAKIDKNDRQPHLSAEYARALLRDALATFRLEHGTAPARVVLHKTSTFNGDEIEGFRSAADEERISSLDLVSIRRSRTRLFRVGTYAPLRGTVLHLDNRSSLLYTKGSVQFYRACPTLYVPRPIEFCRDETEQTATYIARELLALSKMNWNTTQFDGAEPITIWAARQVGDILKHVRQSDPMKARYGFYM